MDGGQLSEGADGIRAGPGVDLVAGRERPRRRPGCRHPGLPGSIELRSYYHLALYATLLVWPPTGARALPGVAAGNSARWTPHLPICPPARRLATGKAGGTWSSPPPVMAAR